MYLLFIFSLWIIEIAGNCPVIIVRNTRFQDGQYNMISHAYCEDRPTYVNTNISQNLYYDGFYWIIHNRTCSPDGRTNSLLRVRTHARAPEMVTETWEKRIGEFWHLDYGMSVFCRPAVTDEPPQKSGVFSITVLIGISLAGIALLSSCVKFVIGKCNQNFADRRAQREIEIILSRQDSHISERDRDSVVLHIAPPSQPVPQPLPQQRPLTPPTSQPLATNENDSLPPSYDEFMSMKNENRTNIEREEIGNRDSLLRSGTFRVPR